MTEVHVKQAAIVMSVLAAGWLAVELALKPWLGKQRASSDKSEPSAANESSAANVEPTVANDEPAVANDEPAVKEAATTEAQADDAGDDDPTTSS
ncbi:uncharacterized protein LOC110735508 [Chenopodium quinoa]|uniref:Uncharacterized protein n=1 Tax=Chenopodium quinoa TaxID=63459 RepID=A0A803MWL5_CHEQI|nr:uncharacterized protein LOC110735508 [Chenopodium quinoa]